MKRQKSWKWGMSYDVGEAKEWLYNELWRKRSDQRVGEWGMSCDVGEAMEGLYNELWRRWSDERFGEWGRASPTSQLIIQPFHRFPYVIAHSTTLRLLHLRRCWEHLRDWTEAKPREGKNAGRVVGSGIALFVVTRNEYCPSSIICILSLKGVS